MTASTTPPLTQQLARWGWGAGLILAGTGHLTFVREEFRSQVPPWVPIDADDVVLLSGAVEIALGLGLLALPKERRRMSALATAFLVAVFPGNIAQYRHQRRRPRARHRPQAARAPAHRARALGDGAARRWPAPGGAPPLTGLR